MPTDPALLGSIWTGGLGLATLLCSRIRCLYKRDDEGHCNPIFGCTERSIQDHDELEIHNIDVGGTAAVLLLPKK